MLMKICRGISTYHNYGEYLSEARYRNMALGAPKVGNYYIFIQIISI